MDFRYVGGATALSLGWLHAMPMIIFTYNENRRHPLIPVHRGHRSFPPDRGSPTPDLVSKPDLSLRSV